MIEEDLLNGSLVQSQLRKVTEILGLRFSPLCTPDARRIFRVRILQFSQRKVKSLLLLLIPMNRSH